MLTHDATGEGERDHTHMHTYTHIDAAQAPAICCRSKGQRH